MSRPALLGAVTAAACALALAAPGTPLTPRADAAGLPDASPVRGIATFARDTASRA